jgi:hypothetical protein
MAKSFVELFAARWQHRIWLTDDGKSKIAKYWCEDWGIDPDKINEKTFRYLAEIDEFRRALWIATQNAKTND